METTTDEGHKIWFNGDETKHQHGVGFIVNKERVNSVISCTPINSRIITIRLSARPVNISIIHVYAPTQDYDDDRIEEFYEELEDIIRKTPRKDLIVQGDWNAKVGPDAYQIWAGTVGRFGLGITNDRGQRLLEFACNHNLTLAITLYPHKTSRRETWHAADGDAENYERDAIVETFFSVKESLDMVYFKCGFLYYLIEPLADLISVRIFVVE
ncbi:craniofacial development protein 2-like [Penaeus indicus]|uniref:craniofacial development protein 2-like n=1 Tax=Penaeus indicus TaxID=29960 RepID=UPI00300D8B0D